MDTQLKCTLKTLNAWNLETGAVMVVKLSWYNYHWKSVKAKYKFDGILLSVLGTRP